MQNFKDHGKRMKDDTIKRIQKVTSNQPQRTGDL